MTTDLVLSSGFLAFARHVGVLSAIEECGLHIDGICGTSSGSLTGALWAAGHSAEAIARELSAQRPLAFVRPSLRPWRGLLEPAGMLRKLRALLPPRFEDLGRPFAVGVMDGEGRHHLIRSGALPEAVAASCAIPRLFQPVALGGVCYRDGAFADRLGLVPWRALRGDRAVIAHIVERSSGVASEDGLEGALVIRTPRSGASLWSLGDFAAQRAEARTLALEALSARGSDRRGLSG